MEAGFCVEALKQAIAKYGKPAIMNKERLNATSSSEERDHQGSQFTGFEWMQALKDADVKISMDDRGAGLTTG